MIYENDEDELFRLGLEAFEREDYMNALYCLAPLAEQSNPKAQCLVAFLYQMGFGMSVDGAMAVDLYKKVAAQEIRDENISAVAYNNLGTIYSVGLPGIEVDLNLAGEYFLKAKKLGQIGPL